MPSQTGSIDLTAQVSANNNAKDYSDNVVDNLEIGGRNLLLGSKTQDTTKGNARNSVTETTDTWLGCTVFKSSAAWADIGFRFDLQIVNRELVKAGDILTYSIWAKTDDTASRDIYGIWMSKLNNSSGHFSGTKIATLTNTWTQYSKQITVTQDMLNSATLGTDTRFECNTACTSGKYIYWAAPKLEKGNKATDWTPAPEDQEALVSSINPFIIGTQTAATYAWTGNCPELSELKDGQQITYFLPYSVAGNQITASYTTISSGAVTNVGGASLTLTLANNVSSGQIPIWYGSGMSRVTSHYAYGSVLHLTYREDVTMSGTYYIDHGWFADANYNTDTVYSRTLDGGFITGLNGAGSYSLHMKDANGNWTNIVNQYSTNNTHTVYTGGFKFDEVLYNSTRYTNGIVTTSGTSVGGSLWSSYILDFRYSANVVNTDAGKIIARKPIYLVGTVGSDGLFYLDTTKWWTQTLPTSVDSKVYLYIGTGYDWYRINLQDKKTAYIYHNSKIKEYDEYLSDIAAQTATNYITADANGISIHMAGNSTTYQRQTSDSTTFYVGGKKRSQVGADGLHVYVDSTEDEVAHFGESARIGKSSGFNTLIEEDEFAIRYATDRLFDVSSDGKTTSIYMGGSTLPSGYKYTDNQLSTIYDYLQSGCTVSGRVVLDPNGSDTTWRLSDDGYGFLYDAAGDQIISPGLGEIEYLPSTGTWTIDPPLQPQSEIPGAPVSIDMGNVGIRASNNRLIIMASGVAEGGGTTASGSHSHAEGSYTMASGTCSHAEGASTTATKAYSHTEGYNATASGTSSHAEGSDTSASGISSHAEGAYTTASGDYSHAQNQGTTAGYPNQTVIGKYNDNGYRALEIGNGTSSSSRSNAFIVDWNGNIMARGMAGMVQMFAGSTPPTGWLLCHGQAISRTDYATLFAAIGTTWGSGDGSTTFNLPDLRGRAPIGAGTGSGLTARTLAAKGGSENIQAHTHAFTQPTVKTELKFQKNTASGSAINRVAGSNLSNPAETSTYTATVTGGAVGAVSGASTGTAGNMPPFAVINFIICTGKTS